MTQHKPEKPQQNNPQPLPRPVRKNTQPQPANNQGEKLQGSGGQGGGHHGGGVNGGDGRSNNPPSPWIREIGKLHPSAGFVEYLRWMREPGRNPVGSDHKDKTDPTTQLLVMQTAEESADYRTRLEILTQRTKMLAGEGNWLAVECPWRIRVGGTKGPESMLLPAFDALGIPYIPSSTLRGIARNQAIREIMEHDTVDWKTADQRVAKWFGHLEAADAQHSGKIIFFDAYPTPSKKAGLAIDMANSIWNWDDNTPGGYRPNPNSFFSLKQTSFIVGMGVIENADPKLLIQARTWLLQGLALGTGSQVNAGYGVLLAKSSQEKNIVRQTPFIEIEFDVQGQKIHGAHRFQNLRVPYNSQNGRPDTKPEAEVRTTSLKNMLRYWFRALALGVLSPKQAKSIEFEIFGGIQPPTWGYLCVQTEELVPQYDPHITQTGILKLFTTPALPNTKQATFESLCKYLTWLMFRLGGVGQGSRRPYHKRSRNPQVRGCNLVPYVEKDPYWQLPEDPKSFATQFKQRLQGFYADLAKLADTSINPQELKALPTGNRWSEAIDKNCTILVFRGNITPNDGKSHALFELHAPKYKQGQQYDPNLCGTSSSPSPIWIANAEDKGYQVVTVFGANQNPRRRYLADLMQAGGRQLFPLM